MPTENKRIETLVASARLKEGQDRLEEFLNLCDDAKAFLLVSQEQIAHWEKNNVAGILRHEEGEIERNKISVGFLNQISDFTKLLPDYFNVGDRKQFFDKLKSRDDIILTALGPRVTARDYNMKNLIKDGNSSVVFKLNKNNTGQDAVALVLKRPDMPANTRADFIRLTELRHRNIIKLLDHELDSFPFFVITEFVHGENLVQIIEKTGTRPIAQLVDWLYQLTDALDYMRHKGILHTNVRPSKVFVDEELNIMISPFDFNQTNKEERIFSRFQDVCLYGSPELLLCDGEQLPLTDMCISDQYSLGLIAYKVLTGKDLFEGNSIVEILKNRHKFSTNTAYRRAKLSIFPSNALGQTLKKLLNEDPKTRFVNLHEVVRALHAHTHYTKETRSTNKVRESYRRCLAKNRMLIRDFYDLLFENLPQVKADFQNSKRQLGMMQMAVDLMIDIDEKRPLLMALMTDEKHKSYALTHFDIFIDTLLETMKSNDPQWDNVQLDWLMLRDKTIKVIQEAREEGNNN